MKILSTTFSLSICYTIIAVWYSNVAAVPVDVVVYLTITVSFPAVESLLSNTADKVTPTSLLLSL